MKIIKKRELIDVLIDNMDDKDKESGDKYIFFEVFVPCIMVNNEEVVELFDFTINNGWVEIGKPKIKNTDCKYIMNSHIFAYANDGEMTLLREGEETVPLFDFMKTCTEIKDLELEGSVELGFNYYAFTPEFLEEFFREFEKINVLW